MLAHSDKIFLSRFYSLWMIFWWVLMFLSRDLLHFAGQIVFIPTDVDFVFVLLNNFGILKYIFRTPLFCYLIDYGILILSVATFLFPLKGKLFISLLAFLALFEVGYACASFHHQHGLYSVMIMALPFCFVGKEKEFPLIWRAARYLPIFLYVMAFYWKIQGGSLLHPLQGVAVVKANLAYILLYLSHRHPYSKAIAFFLTHPHLLQFLYVIGLCMEGIFVIGLFTKKADMFLLFIGVLLHVLIALSVDAYFMGHCIIFLPLLSLKKINQSSFYRLLVRWRKLSTS